MKFINKRKKLKKGSITVEASLVIPIFALAMLTLAFVMRLVYIEETMKNSLNHVANNVSQYSYLYKKIGLQELAENTGTAMTSSEEEAKNQKTVILEGFSKINEVQTQETVDAGNISDITTYLQSGGDFETLMNKVKGDPKKEALMLMFAVGNKYKDDVAKAIYEGITKKMFLMDLDESKLNKMNLVDGVDSLDFEGSTFNNGKDIKLVLTYKVKIPFPLISKKVFNMRSQVRVKSWIGEDDE